MPLGESYFATNFGGGHCGASCDGGSSPRRAGPLSLLPPVALYKEGVVYKCYFDPLL